MHGKHWWPNFDQLVNDESDYPFHMPMTRDKRQETSGMSNEKKKKISKWNDEATFFPRTIFFTILDERTWKPYFLVS